MVLPNLLIPLAVRVVLKTWLRYRAKFFAFHCRPWIFTITGSKAQLTKRLEAVVQGVQHHQPKPTGCVQKCQTKSRAVRSRPVDCTDYNSRPALDADDGDELSLVSSLDLCKDPPNADMLEDVLDQPPASFTGAQIVTIRETVQLSVAKSTQQTSTVSRATWAIPRFWRVLPFSFHVSRPGSANPIGLQPPLDKGTEDKIFLGEYIDFTLLLPDTITSPQVPELQVHFNDSGPGSTSNMTMVRKQKFVIDSLHKWLDAYTTYMMVIVSAYPCRALELLKYK